jgi:peptide/nickel transport system substrate-binding protein
MKRRTFLATSAAAAASPLASPAIAQKAQLLRMVPQANLTSLDPIWTTANITRNHAFMIYDTLYGLDSNLEPKPQMAAGHVISDDGRRIVITLRDGLFFHDGARVLARDAVASIKRWMVRNPFGQKLATLADEVSALDDTRLEFRLKKPFPLLFSALAVIGSACFVMPERVAATDPFKQLSDTTGSGPFRYLASEFNSGSFVAYARNERYVPRDEAANFTAGGKRAFLDRVEWRIITDAATSAAALQNNEIDWFEQPPPELQELLRRNRNIVVEPIDTRPNPAMLRLNHLHPPFDRKEARQALLPAIDQTDFMTAIVGPDPKGFSTIGAFTPNTPLASTAGMEAFTSPRSLDRAKALLREAGAFAPRMRLIGPTDILAPAAMTQVAGALFKDLGLNLDFALSDWGTVIQRRASREPVDKGGWSALLTAFGSFDWLDPAAHPVLRGNGKDAWFGWPTIPRIESLRDDWFEAPTLAAQQAIAADLQRAMLDEVPFVPVGAYFSNTALRRDLVGRVSGFALFYNMTRA